LKKCRGGGLRNTRKRRRQTSEAAEGRGGVQTEDAAWHLDPLPPGSKNEVQIDIGKERAAREHMLEAAGWISFPQYADSEFFGKTPATELAYEWLWDGLRRVSWVKGMFNRRFS
jgi:hypothetical protein